MDCAKPAASDSGEIILEPEDNRASEAYNALDDYPRVRLAAVADMFELIIKYNHPKLLKKYSKSTFQLISLIKKL